MWNFPTALLLEWRLRRCVKVESNPQLFRIAKAFLCHRNNFVKRCASINLAQVVVYSRSMCHTFAMALAFFLLALNVFILLSMWFFLPILFNRRFLWEIILILIIFRFKWFQMTNCCSFFWLFAGSCKIAFNVRRARGSRSTQRENIRIDGSDKYAWSWKYDIEGECIAGDINQIDNGRPNQNYTHRDQLKPAKWTNFISRVHFMHKQLTRPTFFLTKKSKKVRFRCAVILFTEQNEKTIYRNLLKNQQQKHTQHKK